MVLRSVDKKPILKNGGFFGQIKKNYFIYLIMLPGILYYLIFRYIPMGGIIIAFKNYKPYMGLAGIFTSEWVGIKHFSRFFTSVFAGQLIRNTFLISFYKLLWGFPAPILLALMLNEVRNARFKKTIQSISYLPHFLSIVIVCGIVRAITSTDGGIVNSIVMAFGGEPVYFLGESRYFRGILVLTTLWQEVGWGTIVYLAAMSGINPQLYEAADMDGANWLRKMIHITIPGVASVISILLILRAGTLLNAGFEQVFLLYSPVVYDVGDVISTYVYREGMVNMKYSFGTAVGLFKSIVALALVLGTNLTAKRMGQEGIW